MNKYLYLVIFFLILLLIYYSKNYKEKMSNEPSFESYIKRKRLEENNKFNSIMVVGYYNSGTNWLHKLLQENCIDTVVHPNQHKYVNSNNERCSHLNDNQWRGKHGRISDRLMDTDDILIIMVVRRFENWLPTHLTNSYETKINDDIITSTYGWPSMNIYKLYSHVIKTNVNILRNSGRPYILCSLEEMQKDKGRRLINLLKIYNFKVKKDFVEINKNTKTKRHIQNNKRVPVNTNYYCKEKDPELDKIIDNLTIEYKR